MKIIWRLILGIFILFMPIHIACAEDWFVKEDGSSYQYRVMVNVRLRGSEVMVDDFPIVAKINFSELLSEAGVDAAPCLDSITVVDPEKNRVIPSYYLPDASVDNAGSVCWRAEGSYLSFFDLIYYIYFNASDNTVEKEIDSNPKGRIGKLMDYLFAVDPEAPREEDNIDLEDMPAFGLYIEAEDLANKHKYATPRKSVPNASRTPGSEYAYLAAGPSSDPSAITWMRLEYASEALTLPSGIYNCYVRFVSDADVTHDYLLKVETANETWGTTLTKTIVSNGIPNWKWDSLKGMKLTKGNYGFYWQFVKLEKCLNLDQFIITNYDFNPPDNFLGFDFSLGKLELQNYN